MWDVGGQKSLRSYWRNYFESTDGLIWVVDSADKWRFDDCKTELSSLLLEEVNINFPVILITLQDKIRVQDWKLQPLTCQCYFIHWQSFLIIIGLMITQIINRSVEMSATMHNQMIGLAHIMCFCTIYLDTCYSFALTLWRNYL